MSSSMITDARAYNKGHVKLDVRLEFYEPRTTALELYQNSPNPFSEGTMIGFHLPEDGDAVLKVFDACGKVIDMVQGYFHQGYNQINLNKDNFLRRMVYF